MDTSFDLLSKTRITPKKKQTIVRISSELHVSGLTPALKRLRPSNQDKIQMHLTAALGISSMSGVNGNVVIQPLKIHSLHHL